MTGPEFPTVETRRLVLRPWEPSDAPAIYRYRSDPEIYRYMRPEPPASPDVVAESIRRWSELSAEDRTPMWVIALKEEGVVGLIGFTRLDRANSSAYLTYEVARQHWGKGIVTEAVRAVLGYGFGTLGLNRIAAYCWEGNMASRRVMEKAGMRYEGTLRQSAYVRGAYRDMRFYSVLASEWKAKPGIPKGSDGTAGDP